VGARGLDGRVVAAGDSGVGSRAATGRQ
jgi:hypothetical protein